MWTYRVFAEGAFVDALHGLVELDDVGEPEGSHTGLSFPRIMASLFHGV